LPARLVRVSWLGMKTALVTGILGQDGTYLAELLAGKGYRVVGTSRSPAGRPAHPGAEVVALDVTNAEAVASLVAAIRPQEVYHLAAQSSVGVSFKEPLETYRTNTMGTLNVLEAVRRTSPESRVLVASSCEAFGDTGGVPANENTALCPLNAYSAAKAASAHAAASYRAAFGLAVSIAYFYNHESPLRDSRFVTKKIARTACRIARGLEQRLDLGDVTVVRDWGWAPEYMDAAWRILGKDAPEDFVIASGSSISLEEFVDAIFARVGLRSSDHVFHDPKLVRAVDIPVMRADPSRAAERLGWRATIHGVAVAERLADGELAALDAELSR
jgi:GDPmannose 4,6-dehydratase